MIQRIQSVYLLLVALLMGATVFTPLATFISTSVDGSIASNSIGIYTDQGYLSHTWGVLTFAALTTLLAFVNIFLYKKRKTQIKLCYFIFVFVLVFYGTLAVYTNVVINAQNLEFSNIGIGFILPIIALIFNFLALRKIKSDEKLVRSLDRIR